MSFLLTFRTGYTRTNIWTTLQTHDQRALAGQLKKTRRKRSRAIRAGREPFSDGRRARLHKSSRSLFFNLLILLSRAGHVYMQIWVFLFTGDGVNLAKGGETTSAHPQAGTALDRLVFAYTFPFLLLLYCSVFAKNHNVWMTGAYYYFTSCDISFVYLYVCLSVSISGVFFSIALGREGNVDTVFSFVFVVIYQPGAS